MAEGEDRTQAASERRLQRAREEGQAPLSRELVVAGGLAAAALVLVLGAGQVVVGLAGRLRDMMLAGSVEGALARAGAAWGAGAGAMMGAALVAGCAGVLLQTGFLLHGRALLPDAGRLDPRRGLRRVFGRGNAVEALKAVVKLGVLAWAMRRALADVVPESFQSLGWTAGKLMDRMGRDLVFLVLLVLAAQGGMALLDVGWTRWRFAQRLRMGREELRLEQRESDGDPKVKGRLKQLRLARGRRRMLAAVPKATVVLTNPTHYAVALAYQRGTQGAPRVVAKGADEVAARIREAAREAGVPLVANPPLARALYAVALDAEVPAEHFRAVAEIVAYVWRLRGMAGR